MQRDETRFVNASCVHFVFQQLLRIVKAVVIERQFGGHAQCVEPQ